jgi:hypothetical protein
MGASASPSYPTRAQIARTVQAARPNGVSVAMVETSRDGTIRVGSMPMTEKLPKTLFDELDAEGLL